MSTGLDPDRALYERRLRAAWMQYLIACQEAPQRAYDQLELEAWELLQRRLRRNTERYTEARATPSVPQPEAADPTR